MGLISSLQDSYKVSIAAYRVLCRVPIRSG